METVRSLPFFPHLRSLSIVIHTQRDFVKRISHPKDKFPSLERLTLTATVRGTRDVDDLSGTTTYLHKWNYVRTIIFCMESHLDIGQSRSSFDCEEYAELWKTMNDIVAPVINCEFRAHLRISMIFFSQNVLSFLGGYFSRPVHKLIVESGTPWQHRHTGHRLRSLYVNEPRKSLENILRGRYTTASVMLTTGTANRMCWHINHSE